MDIYRSDKLGKELLHSVAVQLEKWSHDNETAGRQHQPMENLAQKIFNHLKASQQADPVEWINPCQLKDECSISCIESIQTECRLYLASIN